MAEQLNNKKVRMGVALPVKNTEAAPTECSSYYALKLEDESGKVECWTLLTAKELYNRRVYKCGGWADDLKLGRTFELHPLDSKTVSYIVRISRPEQDNSDVYETVVVQVSEKLLSRAIVRATKNPEDVPSQGLIADLLD